MPHWKSEPGIVDVEAYRGPSCDAELPDLVIEVPHGATELADFEGLRDRLRGPLPERLEDFFLVNTDVGAYELGRRIAELWVHDRPGASAVVLRCRIPRTLIDTNRIIDGEIAEGITPGIPPYVRDPEDLRTLVARYEAYQSVAASAIDAVCEAGGLCVLPHSYAPRTVGIERVDDDIVANLHAAYAPDVVTDWPLRPEIDLIVHDEAGNDLAPPGIVDALRRELGDEGYEVAVADSYTLHRSTVAWRHASRHPGQALCFEVRRDLLVEEFVPFRVMRVDPARVERLAAAFERVLRARSAG